MTKPVEKPIPKPLPPTVSSNTELPTPKTLTPPPGSVNADVEFTNGGGLTIPLTPAESIDSSSVEIQAVSQTSNSTTNGVLLSTTTSSSSVSSMLGAAQLSPPPSGASSSCSSSGSSCNGDMNVSMTSSSTISISASPQAYKRTTPPMSSSGSSTPSGLTINNAPKRFKPFNNTRPPYSNNSYSSNSTYLNRPRFVI